MKRPRAEHLAVGALTFACLIWGSTFLLMELGGEAVRRAAPEAGKLGGGAFFLLVRFSLAALLAPLVLRNAWSRANATAWSEGFWLSCATAGAYVLQIYGLGHDDVNPSESAYLTSLYVVATPLLASAISRRIPRREIIGAALVAMAGAAVISGPPTHGLSRGAWATVGCAVLFGMQIVLTDRASRKVDPSALTFTMLVWCTFWVLLAWIIAPGGLSLARGPALWSLVSDPVFLAAEGVCSILATLVALAIFNRWQKELDPSRAAVVYTSEPVFAALFSVAAGRDRVTGWMILGGVLILGANLVAEAAKRRDRTIAG